MTKSTLAVLGLLLVLAGCSDSGDETVTAAELPANLCEVVPAAQVTQWDLVEDTQSTDNEGPINSARCTMSGGATSGGTGLELSVDSLGGGDAQSATRFATELFTQRCGDVRTQGEFVDTGEECTATREEGGTRTLTTLTLLPDSYSMVRVQLVAPIEDVDDVDDAVGELVKAVRARVEGSTA